MCHRIVTRVAAAALAVVGLVASAQAFECPTPQPTKEPGVIKETPAQIAELQPLLGGADVSLQVPQIVKALQKRYPNASAAEIANYLITAYCPGVAKVAGLDDTQKTQRAKDFSRAVLAVLY